jgi:RNA polymerase sigma-70 factor (ECF subfamily)
MPSGSVDMNGLVDRFYAELYRYALRLSGSASEAEDLVQEAFLTAQAKGGQIRDVGEARAWLYTVLRNVYLQQVRSPGRQRARSLDQVPEPWSAGDPRDLNLDFDGEALQRALQDLCEEYRTPLVLYYFGHLSYREIAAQLQVPLGTVMSRLARAKGWLRDRLTLAAPTPLATTPPGAAP